MEGAPHPGSHFVLAFPLHAFRGGKDKNKNPVLPRAEFKGIPLDPKLPSSSG